MTPKTDFISPDKEPIVSTNRDEREDGWLILETIFFTLVNPILTQNYYCLINSDFSEFCMHHKFCIFKTSLKIYVL